MEHASHTYGYYSYNTYKPALRLLSVLRTVTVITRTIHTSLFHGYWACFAHLRLLHVQYRQACFKIVEHASHTYGYYSYNTNKPVVQLLSTLRTLTVITRTIHTSLFHDCWARFALLRLLHVQYTQSCSTIVERASHTYGYYSYNTRKPVVGLLRALGTLTLITRTLSLLWALRRLTAITRTIQTSLLYGCWQSLAHSHLILVQYTQACCVILESASHTHAFYLYNTDKPRPRLLSALRTLTLINRPVQWSLMVVFWGSLYSHAQHSDNTNKPSTRVLSALRILTLINRTVQSVLIVDSASYTHPFRSYNYADKSVVRLLRALRKLTLSTRTIKTTLGKVARWCSLHSFVVSAKLPKSLLQIQVRLSQCNKSYRQWLQWVNSCVCIEEFA